MPTTPALRVPSRSAFAESDDRTLVLKVLAVDQERGLESDEGLLHTEVSNARLAEKPSWALPSATY